MKNKMKLKRYGRRALALLSCFAMVLPLALTPVSADELKSQDITRKVVNGQVAIYRWEAIHDLNEFSKGMHYILPILVGDRLFIGSSTTSINSDDGTSWGVQTYPVSQFSWLGGRKFNYDGHPGDVFYTVGDDINPIVISREDDSWDSTNHGPMVKVWISDTYQVDDVIKDADGNFRKVNETQLFPLTRDVDKYGSLADAKQKYDSAKQNYEQWAKIAEKKTADPNEGHSWDDIYVGLGWFSGQMNKWGPKFKNFAQAIAAQRSKDAPGPNLLAWADVSKWCLCYYNGDDGDDEDRVRGQFSLTYEWTGPNPSIRYRPDNYNAYVLGEDESLWDWRIRMNMWDGVPTMYSTLTQSYNICDGQTLSLNAEEGFNGVYIPKAMKLVVQPGGTLSISENVYNDGTIINNGGTVVVQAGGSLVNLAADGRNEITVNNGDFIIMPETKVGDTTYPAGRVYINSNYPMTMINSRLINFGYLILGGNLNLYSSFIENRKGGVIAGNMRFGDTSLDRFFQTYWDSTQKKYVRNTGCWLEIDNQTKIVLNKSSWWSYGNYTYDDMVSEANYRNSYLERDGSLPREKKDWTPYFQDTDLSVLQSSTFKVPKNMVNFKNSTDYNLRSKVYVYDSQNHYNTYGCITVEDGSYVHNLDIGQPGHGEGDLVKNFVTTDLATYLNEQSGKITANLSTDNAGKPVVNTTP